MSTYIKESVVARCGINRQLVLELSKLVEKHPTQRFGQILLNYFFYGEEYIKPCHFKNIAYNEEPSLTLARVCSNDC